jgi:hypothetical protein
MGVNFEKMNNLLVYPEQNIFCFILKTMESIYYTNRIHYNH